MAKKKTSIKRKSYSPKLLRKPKAKPALTKHKVSGPRVKDVTLVKETLIEMLMNDDLESFQDVLIAHIKACPKSQLARQTKLGRQTLYDLVSEDKEFNPTFKTLGAILQALPA